MPIQFPQSTRGNRLDRWRWQGGAPPLFVQRTANLARVGQPFTSRALAPGLPQPATVRPNLRNLGQMYQDGAASAAVVNPADKLRQASAIEDGGRRYLFGRELGTVNMSLSGVSRDSAGAVLGNCRVLFFRTADNSFIAETTSDGAGAWAIFINGGPFFLVEYKAGTPDLAGTSVNTLLPNPT